MAVLDVADALLGAGRPGKLPISYGKRHPGLLAKFRKETHQYSRTWNHCSSQGKNTGTTIDAYCAALQAQCEANGSSPSWRMFSSWLAILASRKSKNLGLGTIDCLCGFGTPNPPKISGFEGLGSQFFLTYLIGSFPGPVQ
ncbi:hypothetical protein GGX14DRAFT_392152 [Mycena pura]|uniref:Uncharacterized protein n=1 Tax=Mycena pura TaxID=153505 RepID=A0AAD6YFV6_9AGAR|nr:hypothetical protein GGX14DRAFT_392152 [Mycena pura]